MKSAELIRRRLANQRLTTSNFKSPAEVVAAQGAVQAQDFSGALWALGLRLPGTREADIEQAFIEGAILRTHVLRPTWHFVTPADIRWMLKLTAPRVKITMRSVNRRVGLSEADFKRSNELIRKVLKGGKQLTRSEIAQFHVQAGLRQGNEEPLRMAQFMMEAELDAIITSGPLLRHFTKVKGGSGQARRGKQFTYMLMDERAAHTQALTREESLAELTRRYFATRSLATAKDFSWWSGLNVGDARAGINALGSELKREMIGGKEYWFSETRPPAKNISEQAYLLPNYDEYGIGFVDRSAIYEPAEAEKIKLRDRPIFGHVVLVNGRAQGTWKRELAKGEVRITVSMFRPLSKMEKARVGAAAKRYGDFLGLKPKVSYA